jgi:class 3 adenylate cyclase/tetratricopeptide (TPR) repeat protein
MRCPKCNRENAPGARFCAQCGARLEAACPACGAAVGAEQKFCSACGHALRAPIAKSPEAAAPRDREPAAEAEDAERRYATIAFSDLSGYTALNERLDPEEVEEIMRRIKREATSIIERNGGTVNQFVGDEVMALFGVPLARRDDPKRAVRAALALHQAVRGIAAEVESRTGGRLTMHTGINTGLVVARRTESHAGRFTLTGDTVNTASRLLKLAGPDEVVVSAETWRQVRDSFEGLADAPIEVKGKQLPIVPYRILGERPAAQGRRRPLVGRAEEMHQFAAIARACGERRRGRVILLRGDPGIGKSRLAAEFVALAQDLGFSCHTALVLDFGAETGQDAVRSIVRSLLDVPADADEESRRSAVRRSVHDGLIGSDREVLLYDLLDIAPPHSLRSIHAALSVEAREHGTVETLAELVRNSSARQPLLLLVEDLHWADARTLERLAALGAAAAAHPVLLASTTRFEGDPMASQWRAALRGVPTTCIDLGPLASDDAADFAAEFSEMPESVVHECIERAEGNPLFLEELLLNAEAAASQSLAGSIQALVLARMDRLAPAHKSLLQAASVLGQRFSLEALRHLVEDAACDCGPLVEHFLVRPEGTGFLFCHVLFRDGAYESMLKARRKKLHTRAAEWFETRDPALAAEHFDRAADPRAARAYLAASELEAAQFRYERSLALAERGLGIAGERNEKFALLALRAKLLLDTGRTQESIEASRAALEAAEAPGERAKALIGMAAGMRIKDQFDEALAALAEAQPLAEQTGMPLELSRLHHLRGNLCFPLGRIDQCLREHNLALAHAEKAGSLEAEANALGGLGDAYYLSGRMRSANEQFKKCVALCRQHGFGRLEVTILHMVGWTAAYLNEMRPAVEVGMQAAELAARVSHLRAEMLARMLAGYVDGAIRGNAESAGRQLDAALALARRLGAKRFEAQILQFQAMLAARLGDRERALALLDEGLRICREHGMSFTGAWLHGVIARVAPEASARARALAEGEGLLAGGCVSHNHFHFYAAAVEASLEAGEWDAAARYCDKLESYAAREPLPWTEFVIARGRALARFRRGERNPELLSSLAQLRAEAEKAEIEVALPALDAALLEARTAPERASY